MARRGVLIACRRGSAARKPIGCCPPPLPQPSAPIAACSLYVWSSCLICQQILATLRMQHGFYWFMLLSKLQMCRQCPRLSSLLLLQATLNQSMCHVYFSSLRSEFCGLTSVGAVLLCSTSLCHVSTFGDRLVVMRTVRCSCPL